jgi:hypothetical protein
MQSNPNASLDTGGESRQVDELVFSQWARERLGLYRDMERHLQDGIAHILELSTGFTARMEEETNHLLSRYREQRAAEQAQLEAIRKEMSDLRATIAREQQEHADSAVQRQQEVEAELATSRRNAAAEIEDMMARAHEERDHLLRDTYAERDRVLAETQRLGNRLSELQQDLQRLLSTVMPLAFSEDVLQLAPVMRESQREQAEQATGAYEHPDMQVQVAEQEAAEDVGAPEYTEQEPELAQSYEPDSYDQVEDVAPATGLEQYDELTVDQEPPQEAQVEETQDTDDAFDLFEDYSDEPARDTDDDDQVALEELLASSEWEDSVADEPARDSVWQDEVRAVEPEEAPSDGTRLVIEGVTRFALAWDLIDRLEQNPVIEEVNLLLYEENTLLLLVQHASGHALNRLLQDELGDMLEYVRSEGDAIYLVSRVEQESI